MNLFARGLVCLILLASTSMSSFAYAECATCNKAPSELDKYFWVMDELLTMVDVTPEETDGLEGVAKAVGASLDVTTNALILAEVLGPQTVGNMFDGLLMMHREESVRREWDRLTDMDIEIAQRAMYMASAQRHNDKIPVEVLEQVDQTLQELEYVKLAKTDFGKYFMDLNGATYAELVDLLWKMNRFYKKLHEKKYYHSTLESVGMGFWATDDLEEEEALKRPDNEALAIFYDQIFDLTEDVFWFCKRAVSQKDSEECSPVDVLDFNISGADKEYKELMVHIWQIQDDYECSTGLGNECHEWNDIKDEAKELFSKRLTNDVEESINMFVESRGLLMGALHGPNHKNKQAAQARKEALTSSYRGPNWSKDGEESRFITRTRIEEAPQSIQGLRKSLEKVFDKQDRDLVSKSKEKQSFKEWMSGRTLGKFWFVKGKYAEEPTVTDQPDAKGDDLKNNTKESKLSKVDETIADAHAKEDFKWQPMDVDERSRGQAEILNAKVDSFRNTFQQVLAAQEQAQIESVFSDVNSVTHQFPALSAAIYQNMDIIGKKNSEGQLYHAMGNVCELQCSNLGTNCWYHAE